MKTLITLIILCVFSTQLNAKGQHRSYHAKKIFKLMQACPATGQYGGKCKGWIIDHIVPISAGGQDHWSNMQWQSKQDSYVKDSEERRYCRTLKRMSHDNLDNFN